MNKNFKKSLVYFFIGVCCTYSVSAYELQCPLPKHLKPEYERDSSAIYTGTLIGKGDLPIKSIHKAPHGTELYKRASTHITEDGGLECSYEASNMFHPSQRYLVQLTSHDPSILHKCTSATIHMPSDAFTCKE